MVFFTCCPSVGSLRKNHSEPLRNPAWKLKEFRKIKKIQYILRPQRFAITNILCTALRKFVRAIPEKLKGIRTNPPGFEMFIWFSMSKIFIFHWNHVSTWFYMYFPIASDHKIAYFYWILMDFIGFHWNYWFVVTKNRQNFIERNRK